MSKYVIGVDGGGTKTKFVISDIYGNIIGDYITGTLHYLQIGLDGLEERLKDGIKNGLEKYNIDENEISAVFVGCPGYGDIEKDTSSIELAIDKALGDIPHSYGNDMTNALAGSLGGVPGINVIAGTGSIGLGTNDEGDSFHSGGWHHYFGGDEGSAHWIACKLILHFTQQADGRECRTLLFDYMRTKLNFSSNTDILDLIINEYNLDREQIASLSIIASELADQGDPIAISVFEEAAFELSKIYSAIAKNLSFNDEIRASYSGGVFRSGEHILKPLRKHLLKKNINLVDPLYEPDIGSVIEALKFAKIPVNELTHQNLRNSLLK